MQTKLSHTNYDYFENLNNENIECPIDIEYSLPDYCPDIQKILKCIPYVELSAYSFTQDKFMCEGKLILHVEYMDEKNKSLRVCEIVKEYSSVKDVQPSSEKTFGKVNVSTGHIVCRAVSARKLDIHAPVKIELSLYTQKQNSLGTDTENLEKMEENITVSDAVQIINHQFIIEQEIELSKSSMPIESILRKEINILNSKTNFTQDQLQIEGLAELSVVYRTFSDNFSTEKVNYSLPFNQVIDVIGADNDSIVNLKIDCFELSVQGKEDNVGENTICQVYIKLNICAEVYNNKQLSLITDAYSTDLDCSINYKNINLMSIYKTGSEKLNIVKNIFLAEDEVEKLYDYWCEESQVASYCEKSRINYRGKFNVSIIYQGKSKQLFSVTKTFDFSFTHEFKDINQRKSDCSAKMIIKDFKIIDGNNIEFSCEAQINYAEFVSFNKKVLWNVEVLKDDINTQEKALKIYYSKKDEKLWDIGKIYHISVEDLIENNSLTDNVLSVGGPLVIY
ncbi:MAG: DUF3794 domain-containing protein [Clostridia bacterium]